MTQPPYGEGSGPPGGNPGSDFPPPPGYYPPPGGYPGPSGYPPPVSGPYWDPSAPFGRDLATGQPLSDKSKFIAGLLQLIGLFWILGIGRFYLGQVGMGVLQLLVAPLAGLVIGLLTCGVGFAIPIIWAIVDAVLIFSGHVRDSQGRPLRDGV